MTKRVVAVQISGQEYRIRSDADEESLQQVANLVNAAMSQIASRTGTVDSLDVAILTCLNLGRELVALRERIDEPSPHQADEGRLRELIELAESVLQGTREDGEQTPLLTVPAGSEVDGSEAELLGTLIDDSAVESKAARS